MARLATVVSLDLDGIVRQRQDILIIDAETLPFCRRSGDVARGLTCASLAVDHLELLAAQRSAQHCTGTALERGLENHELIRLDGSLDDIFPKTVTARDQHDVA